MKWCYISTILMEGVAFLLLTCIQLFEILKHSCRFPYIKFILINKKYWKLGSFFRLNIFRLINFIYHFHLGTLSTYKQKDAKSVSLCTALQIQCPIFIQMTPISQCQHEILVQRHLVPLFFSSALFILKKMRKKTFRPDEKLTHNFETKQRHKDIMLVSSWVQIQQRVSHTTKSHNLFVTSKNETTNSPIHEFKVLHKGQRVF